MANVVVVRGCTFKMQLGHEDALSPTQCPLSWMGLRLLGKHIIACLSFAFWHVMSLYSLLREDAVFKAPCWKHRPHFHQTTNVSDVSSSHLPCEWWKPRTPSLSYGSATLSGIWLLLKNDGNLPLSFYNRYCWVCPEVQLRLWNGTSLPWMVSYAVTHGPVFHLSGPKIMPGAIFLKSYSSVVFFLQN